MPLQKIILSYVVMIFHDTVTFPNLNRAIDEFLSANSHWKVLHHYVNNNGLKILERNL